MNRYAYLLSLTLLVASACSLLEYRERGRMPEATATIADVKEYYREGRIGTVPAGTVVDGAVVDVDPDRLVIEDETGGLLVMITLGSAQRKSMPHGQRVWLDVSGLAVGGYDGVVRLGAAGEGSGLLPVPIEGSLERLSTRGRPERFAPTDVAAYALGPRHYNRLVRVCGVQVVAADTAGAFADAVSGRARNVTLTDCRGNEFTLRTGGGAGFAEAPLPKGHGCVTGVASSYRGAVQLSVGTLADVDLRGERCSVSLPFDKRVRHAAPSPPSDSPGVMRESFSEHAERAVFGRAGWTNVSVPAGAPRWRARDYRGNGYVQATAHGDTLARFESWLISPPIATDSGKRLSFRTAQAYYRHDGLEVLWSGDFGLGMSPGDATWAPLPVAVAGADNAEHEWVTHGPVSLPDLTDTVVVAFRYTGSGPLGETTTFRLDDVLVEPY